MRTTVSCSLFYESPDKIRIEDRTNGSLSLHVSDGKTMFYQDENGSFSNPLDSIPGAMRSITFPVGKYFADWTQNRHPFQPAVLPDTLRDALLLEVIHLRARSLNGQTVKGVRIRSKYKETGRLDLFREEILWFNPDNGALVRIQFQSRRGKRVGSGAVDVVLQTFDAPIPASKFLVPTAKC